MMVADDDLQNLMDVDLNDSESHEKENDFFRLKRKLPYGLSKVAQQASNVARNVVRNTKDKTMNSSSDEEKSLFHIGTLTKDSIVRTSRHAEMRLLRALNRRGSACHTCTTKFSILKPRHQCTMCLHEFCGMCASHFNKEVATSWLCLMCRRNQAQQLAALSPPRSPRPPKAPCDAAINAALPDDVTDNSTFTTSTSPIKASPSKEKEFYLTDIFTDDIAQQFYSIDFDSPPVKKTFSAFPTPAAVPLNPFSNSPFALMPAPQVDEQEASSCRISEEELLQSYENAMREFLALSIEQPMSSIFDALQRVSDTHHPIVFADKQTMTPTPDKVATPPSRRNAPDAETPTLYMKPITLFRHDDATVPCLRTPTRSTLRTPLQVKSSSKRVSFGKKALMPSTSATSPHSTCAVEAVQLRPLISFSVTKATIVDPLLSSTSRVLYPQMIDSSSLAVSYEHIPLAPNYSESNEVMTRDSETRCNTEKATKEGVMAPMDELLPCKASTFTLCSQPVATQGISYLFYRLRRPVYALLYLAIFASAYYSSRLIFSSYAANSLPVTSTPAVIAPSELDISPVLDTQITPCTEYTKVPTTRKVKTVVLQPTIIHKRKNKNTHHRRKSSRYFELHKLADISASTAKVIVAQQWRNDLMQRVMSWISTPMLFLRRAWTGECKA